MVAVDGTHTIEVPFQMYYHPLRSFFIPNRCHLCIDHYAELADVSFGDIHWDKYKLDKNGLNSLVVRNKELDIIIKDAVKQRYLDLYELSESELVNCQRAAITKKSIVGGYLKIVKLFGGVTPQYDITYLKYNIFRALINHIFIKCQMFVGKHKSLWWIISIMKKKGHID